MNTKNNHQHTRILALGGLGEIGKNMYVVEYQDELIIIDAGVMFPDQSLLGIDYVLPDFTYLKENEHKIKGVFITHGHEDHIGAIPFLAKEVKIPVIYASLYAGKLIEKKAKRNNQYIPKIEYYDEDTVIRFNNIMITFFTVTHSIPDAFGLYIKTPDGSIVETGDFKFDFTPIGPVANLHKMAAIAQAGVTLLMSESTNVMLPGFGQSESKVDEALNNVFAECKGRIIVATFASNVYRLTHIIETCRKNNRKIAIFGRSMENYIEIATETGLIKDDGIIVSPEVANTLKPHEVCLLCTGSQGEPLAALSRIAKGMHRQISIAPTDTVIFSSSPIPGNAISVAKTLNLLHLKGVKVYTNSILKDVHTSGHAYEEECKLMIRMFKPKFFMAIHGEHIMQRKNIEVAVSCGVPKENTFFLENGDILEMKNEIVTVSDKIIVNDNYVDGNRIGDTHSSVMRDRQVMANDGILMVIANIDLANQQVIGKVNITTRGFILINENIPLLREIETVALKALKQHLANNNIYDIKNIVVSEVNSFIQNKLGRNPLVMPMINDIKKTS